MILQSLKAFVEKNDTYAQKLRSFGITKEPDQHKYEQILDILCQFLMNPESTDDVAECFPQLLPALIAASVPMKEVSLKDDAALHKLNSVILAKLLCKNKDLQVFVRHYFDINPAPFQSIDDDYSPPSKKPNKRKVVSIADVSDYDLVTACYHILSSAPLHFKYIWKWSKFYKYLAHESEAVRWVAMNCFAIVLGMSESSYSSLGNNFVSKIRQYAIECKEVGENNITLEDMKVVDEMLDKSSVISVGGILLPIFKKSKSRNELHLVPVPSTNRNLRNLAFAVSSNKCVCLQGAVGSGKTALVEFLAQATGHDSQQFSKVQLGDQTDSKMLLGMYRCTDIPGEFLWQPGILTEAVLSGKWLLVEDIDCATTDVISVIGQLAETKTLSVPGYRDLIRVKSGFQLFVTRRLPLGGAQKTLQLPLHKNWSCINVEPLSKEELAIVVQTLFPVLNTVATRIVDVFLLFSVGNHEDGGGPSIRSGRQISTRDLIKWCSRAVVDFDVSSPVSALKIFQDALDVFCCSVPDSVQRLNLAIAVAHKLGIVQTKAEFFCRVHKPSVNHHKQCIIIGRAKLGIKKADRVKLGSRNTNFSYTRPSVCLLERIASCIIQKEPVLLVGETGTGKTSCVQYLAQITGHKLIVINMNQQSESTDLLGGYKPVDLRLLIQPIREEFEILFRTYFAVEPNVKFLNQMSSCCDERKWKSLTTLMIHSATSALLALKSSKSKEEIELSKKWQKLKQKLEKLQSQVQSEYSLAFSFMEGSLVKALKNGEWVLLDEINLATSETLECLSGLLEGSCGSLSLLERGDKEPIKRHRDFAIFACMNPATDVGKKDLPVGLRNRFTEFFVDELTEKSDLQLLVGSYLKDLNLAPDKIENIVKYYLNVRKEAESNLLDGTGHKPHYSLRTLCRALSVSAQNPCANALRSLYEAFCLSFLTQLDRHSYPLVQRMIVKAILGEKAAAAVIGTPISRPRTGSAESFICFEGYWIPKGDLEPCNPENYILTQTVRQNLKDLVRVVSIGKMPVLLQGDTSVGKTSLITYLAKASGHVCVRINNHEHTDLQEYVGTYVADSEGKLVFKEGILVDAMRKGYWIILDELNLAPSDVLEALNRVLDDNRELFVPETQQVVKAHDNFMLFATQNPPGLYGGRKVLSRAFRNRFVELHFDEIPPKELQVILQKRCKMPETYCKQVINVMLELQVRRKSTATFAGKKGFITLRDLFRWAERYHLAPDTGSTLYDWSQHLADEGYLVLSSKVRRPEECSEIIQVLKKHLKRDVDPNALFTLSEKTSPVTKPILESLLSKKIPGFEHVVWTFQMRKMAVLLSKACAFKEPVLLVGETGGGKTTVCQLLSVLKQQELCIINCHMHTEASDFLGSLRPVRYHKENQKLFEWVDGPLVTSMKMGGFFLVDEISLADDSVLERLNSVLEPERKLLIAEKPCTEGDAVVTADKDFIFVGTMNPGGDYGKKELSPALRNRFTEIWCENCVSSGDLECIMLHNLRKDYGVSVCTAITEFLAWLQSSEIGKRLVVSIRDILTWVNFVNSCKFLQIGDAFYHGAVLSYVDGLGSGLTAAENSSKLKEFKQSALKFIKQEVQSVLNSELTDCDEFDVEDCQEKFGICPFYVRKGKEQIPEEVGFAFASPTTKANTVKVLRALQLKKPILLEGSPGVGKTSLVSAIAKASGHRLLRLNLSDQTDISDLFGADLPVDGGNPGEFSWRDGPFLQALKNGDWILLDELNLASQSVLEGLNACLDHRGEVYIPELGMTFGVKPGTRLFGCQNPLLQGGGRRGLPKSFLNRFTQVFIDVLERRDLKFILKAQFSTLPESMLDRMIQFNEELSSQIGTTWGHAGSPWEMNLRDVIRWCEITMEECQRNSREDFNPGKGAQLIYVDRMRTNEDKKHVVDVYDRIFSLREHPLPDPEFLIHLTKDEVFLGSEMLDRADSAVDEDDDLFLLREQKTVLRGLAQCVKMNWMAILIGGSGSGKTSLIRLLANLAGQKLKSIVVNSATDTTEILGGFEQTDYDRHFEELLERVETLLIGIFRKKLNKENLCQVAHYHELLENVRYLSANSGRYTGEERTMEAKMSPETELFLRKTEELLKLVSRMNILEFSCQSELLEIKNKLTSLSTAVKKDRCLNAGGKFEWVDSVLVKCVQNGTWLLLDQVNLCSPAILDRLNALLEPDGSLTIGEKGVDQEGNVFTVKAHKNFRLFLTMDPRHGEISRAMRNRGVEINVPPPCNSLDIVSLLSGCGIKKLSHQKIILKIHESLYEKQYKLNEMLQVASFTSQQMSKGFIFKQSLRNSYRELCGTFNWRLRKEAHRKIDEILWTYVEDEENEFLYDLNALSLRISDLRRNAKLAVVKQQGFLLKSAVEKMRKDSRVLNFEDLLEHPSITDPVMFVSHLLLDFYERSSLDDLEIRRLWTSHILSKIDSIQFKKINEYLGKEVQSLKCLFGKQSASEVPLSLTGPLSLSNNLAIALYFQLIIVSCESEKIIESDEDFIDLNDYSSAVSSGRLSSLKNEPLIVKFVELTNEFRKMISVILGNKSVKIDDEKYIELRDGLKWYRRFCDQGSLKLIDKSRGKFTYMQETSSSLKVHYKWLVKFFKKLLTLLDIPLLDQEMQQELVNFSDKYLNFIVLTDKFRKFRKKVKKLLPVPVPYPTDDLLWFQEKLRKALERITITEEDLIDTGTTKLKILSMGLSENLTCRRKLMEICVRSFQNYGQNLNVADDAAETGEIAERTIQVEAIDGRCSKTTEDFEEFEIWPIYEYFFLLFAYRFQTKICTEFSTNFDEDISSKFNQNFSTNLAETSIDCEEWNINLGVQFDKKMYEENVFRKFEEVPSIPTQLISLMKALNSNEISSKQRVCLFPQLLSIVEKYSENSLAVKYSNVLLNWYDTESEDYFRGPKTIFINKSSLCSLITELFLTNSCKSQRAMNFGNYKTRTKLLRTVQTMLWKNSLVLNSEEFNISTNDSVVLQFSINYYLSAIKKVISSINLKLNIEEQRDLNERVLEPMKLLEEIKEALKVENDAVRRGKGWLLLGYLQVFLFHDTGPIDPVVKIGLKSKYIRQNISELEHLMCVENLQSIVLGAFSSIQKKLSRTNRLKEYSNEARNFDSPLAVRSNTSFHCLKEEFDNFFRNIGSYELTNVHVSQLQLVAEQLRRGEFDESQKQKLDEARTWKNSLERFSSKLEKHFLFQFPDFAWPMIFAVSNLRHGVSILIQELTSMQFQNSDNDISYNLLCFPVVDSCQQNYMDLVELCSSEGLASALASHFKPRKSVRKDRFTMAKIALKEMENLTLLGRNSVSLVWEELNKLLSTIRTLWREQKDQREEETREKESLFKMKFDSKDDEESEFEEMFPGHQQEFLELADAGHPKLQRVPENSSRDKEPVEDSISVKDARRIQEIHWNILQNCSSTRRNCADASNSASKKGNSSSETPETDPEPDFIEPLIQRFELLAPSVKTWSDEQSSQLMCSLNVMISQRSNFNRRKRDQEVYDFYTDPNIPEVADCQLLWDQLSNRTNDLLSQWPENPVLGSIKLIIDRLRSFSIDSSLSRFLVGVELLLTKIQLWEQNAHSAVSLAEFSKSFGERVMRWRKLEISRWKESLEVLENNLKTEASKWWFFLFDLVDQYLGKDTQQTSMCNTDDVSKEKLIESLELFLMQSPLIEFETRLRLIYLFYQHVSHLKKAKRRRELLSILWNVYSYYNQFVVDVQGKLRTLKVPIAKKLNEAIKITRWNDISYWSVKNTAEKTRRTLHKFVREFQKGLRETIASYLTLKIKVVTPQRNSRRELKHYDFVIKDRKPLEDKTLKRIEKLTSRASQFCQRVVLCSIYPAIRRGVDGVIESNVQESGKLRSLEIDQSWPKSKQEAVLKSMLQRKKLLMADYFKLLANLGLSYRVGILAWKNRKSEVIDFTSTPLDIQELQCFEWKCTTHANVVEGLSEQWFCCNKYYYESLIKLNFLHAIFNSGNSDLGMQNIERCRGFSVHLMLLAHRQKATLVNLFKHFVPFTLQVRNLVETLQAREDNLVHKFDRIPPQVELQLLVNNLEQLLETLQISMNQILLYLESCPVESEEDEDAPDLSESAVPVLKDYSVCRNSMSSLNLSLGEVKSIANEFKSFLMIYRRVEKSGQPFLLHQRHINFILSSYAKLNTVKETLINLNHAFTVDHPIAKSVSFLIDKIQSGNTLLRTVMESSTEQSADVEEFQTKLNLLRRQVLLAIQKKHQALNEKVYPAKKPEACFPENAMTMELIDSLQKDISELKVRTVSQRLGQLLNMIYPSDSRTAGHCTRLLLEHVPLLEQYYLFLRFYLHEQVASFRLTCKFIYMQLNVFLELARNGFCQPNIDDTKDDQQEGDAAEGGMGLAEGEGQKDISETIETEDQLEEMKGLNDEDEENRNKDTKEEENGIDMSENFEGRMQDLEKQEEEENSDEDEEDLDKEMGETDETADKLDKELWKDEEEEEEDENQDKENEKEERGSGEKTGREELGAKDGEEENESRDEEERAGADGERKEEKDQINEFEEPETNEDHVDPYHGKHQPEVEPESFDLPEDLNLDEEMKEDNPNGEEENPFDIDQMKEAKLPEEKEEADGGKTEDLEKDEQQDSGNEGEEEADDEDPTAESNSREQEKLDSPEDEQKDDTGKEDQMEEEETVQASCDVGSKEMDASEEVDRRKDGSRDAVESQANEGQMETSPTENSSNDQHDKGTGQSQKEEREGHSGSKQEENAPTSGEERSSTPKRRKPGESDENRSLVRDDVHPSAKKSKTAEMQQDPQSLEEQQKKDSNVQSETYQHITNPEVFDDCVLDAATEEQIRQQASNLEEEKTEETEDDKQEDDDIQMHEDPVEEEEGKGDAKKERPQRVGDNEKEKASNARGERSDEADKMEVGGEVEGETVETARILRGNESSIHTNFEAETVDLTTDDIQGRRSEIEDMLGQWSQKPSSVEAANAWSSISALTESAARELSEKLRLVLEPTLTTRLKGDYRTGKRINMRKVIPYIASEFRKDKIWLRRTKPSKRDYQIVLAIDDSSSMADNHSKELAFESLSLIGKAMTYLEVGQLAVINFGERVNILHPFGESFTEESGARLIQEMKFEQSKTLIGQLLDFSMEMFSSHSSSTDNAKLVTILSDGRGMFSEGVENLTATIRRAKLQNIFLVFIIVDNPLNKDSILDVRIPFFEGGKLAGMRSYMDCFPFPFYIILKDLDTLPIVLSDALRQWFEIVGRIDT